MGRTLTQLIQGVERKLSHRSRFVTNAGTGGAGTWTDATNLDDAPADWYNNMWLYVDDDAKEWHITDDSGAGVLTLDTSATPTTTSDYEISPVRPSLITTALNDAANRLSDKIGRTRVDNSYVTDSPIFNAGFEDTTSATAIDGWQKTTTTMTRISTADKKLGGQYSMELGTAAGYAEPTVEFQDLLTELRRHTPTLYVPCKTSAASNARCSWVIDGTTTYGSYHSGGGGWELLSVTAPSAVADQPDSVNFRLYIDTTAAAYFDNIWIEGGPRLYYYRLPASMTHGPSFIRITSIDTREERVQFRPRHMWAGWQFIREEDDASTTTRNILYVPRAPSFGRWQIVGWEALNTLSARADVAEIDEDRAELLELYAAIIIMEERGFSQDRQRLVDLQRRFSELNARVSEVLGAAQLSIGR